MLSESESICDITWIIAKLLLFIVAHSCPKKVQASHLVRVVLQWAVVTVVTDSVSITVSLVSVVHIWTVVLLIQDACTNKSQSYTNTPL